jgi:hypothetical protein
MPLINILALTARNNLDIDYPGRITLFINIEWTIGLIGL